MSQNETYRDNDVEQDLEVVWKFSQYEYHKIIQDVGWKHYSKYPACKVWSSEDQKYIYPFASDEEKEVDYFSCFFNFGPILKQYRQTLLDKVNYLREEMMLAKTSLCVYQFPRNETSEFQKAFVSTRGNPTEQKLYFINSEVRYL